MGSDPGACRRFHGRHRGKPAHRSGCSPRLGGCRCRGTARRRCRQRRHQPYQDSGRRHVSAGAPRARHLVRALRRCLWRDPRACGLYPTVFGTGGRRDSARRGLVRVGRVPARRSRTCAQRAAGSETHRRDLCPAGRCRGGRWGLGGKPADDVRSPWGSPRRSWLRLPVSRSWSP